MRNKHLAALLVAARRQANRDHLVALGHKAIAEEAARLDRAVEALRASIRRKRATPDAWRLAFDDLFKNDPVGLVGEALQVQTKVIEILAPLGLHDDRLPSLWGHAAVSTFTVLMKRHPDFDEWRAHTLRGPWPDCMEVFE